jgi:hemerythrin-like domain-containing protein
MRMGFAADEEQSLFPPMRRTKDPGASAVLADLDCLEQDHLRCEACHALVDRVVRNWLESGRLDDVQRQRLRAVLDELATIYAAHIQLEETRVFAVASRMLKPEQLREIGEEMKERRSLTNLRPRTTGSSEKSSL